MIKAGGRRIHSEFLFEIRRNCLRNGRSWSTVPIYKKGDKRDCSNYRGISLPSTTYKILSTILLARLTPYTKEITVDHQCDFLCNKSTSDHIFCIRQIHEKKWEYNEAVHQLSIDFKKTYNSVRREVLYNILIECGIPITMVRVIKMWAIMYSRVWVGKHLSNVSPIMVWNKEML